MAKETAKLDMQGLEYQRIDPLMQTDTLYALSTPLLNKEKTKSWFGIPTGQVDLARLSQAVGLTSEEERKYVRAHDECFKKYNRASTWFTLAYYIPLAGVAITLLVIALVRLAEITDSLLMLVLLFVIYIVILTFTVTMIMLTGQRVAGAILHRSYADTLAFIACLNLIVELSLNDLLLPEPRSLIIKRALGLRKVITLLSYRYAITSARSIDLARQHYKKMEYYAGDIERQILISNARTQEKLRQELFSFMKILLTSRYADFKYRKKVTIVEEKVESSTRRILNGISRAVGALLPLLLFVGLVFFPERFTFLGSYTNIIAMVSLAWLLLAVDTLLGVGIIDRVTTLSKAIKELR